jgi:hypothetical protein
VNDDRAYSLESARQASDQHALTDWVTGFLASPGSDNAALAEQLSKDLGWWTGPLQLPLDELNRLVGPPGDPVLCPVDDEYWEGRLGEMDERAEQGWEPPPVIVSYRQDRLVLEDGNHRAESVRRAGRDLVWAIVGFENQEDRERFSRTVRPGATS